MKNPINIKTYVNNMYNINIKIKSYFVNIKLHINFKYFERINDANNDIIVLFTEYDMYHDK